MKVDEHAKRSRKQVGFRPTPYTDLCCLPGSLLEGITDQFMQTINVKLVSAASGLLSGQTVKSNYIPKAGIL